MKTEPYIVSAELTTDGYLEVVTRYPSTITLTCSPPRKAPDRIVRVVYGVRHGCIDEVSRQEGHIEPAQTIAERLVWDGEE